MRNGAAGEKPLRQLLPLVPQIWQGSSKDKKQGPGCSGWNQSKGQGSAVVTRPACPTDVTGHRLGTRSTVRLSRYQAADRREGRGCLGHVIGADVLHMHFPRSAKGEALECGLRSESGRQGRGSIQAGRRPMPGYPRSCGHCLLKRRFLPLLERFCS